MANLIIHCGARAVERAEVESASTPAPTETWFPIGHAQVLQQVESALDSIGLRVVNEAHAIGRDGDRYFGLMHVDGGESHPDYNLVVGVRNSHDQSFPAGLVLGAAITVCDNLSFSGEVQFSRRHTKHINRDLPALVFGAVGRIAELRVQQDERLAAYQAKRLTDRHAHDLLIRLVESKTLPATRLPIAIQEYRSPSHPEFLQNGKRTAYTLMNAVTESIKGRSIEMLPRRSQALHGLLDRACNLN